MNSAEILELIRAGYTKDEIAAMDSAEPAKPDPEPANPDPEPTNPDPEPAKPDPEPAKTTGVPDMAALMAKMAELTQAIQTRNIQESRQPPKETVEDIITGIIRPPRKE